jgi:hypothetical protein
MHQGPPRTRLTESVFFLVSQRPQVMILLIRTSGKDDRHVRPCHATSTRILPVTLGINRAPVVDLLTIPTPLQ